MSGFGKNLAHTDKVVRDKAVEALGKWLSESQSMDAKSMLALWKGLFYCYWMSDKPLIQHELAERLAGLALSLDTTEKSLLYLNGFWSILVKEWFGIDRLRLDKFYNLIRNFHCAAFKLLEATGWDSAAVEDYILILENGVLSVSNIKVPDSLRYHSCEVYLEELNKGVTERIPVETSILLLRPFIKALSTSSNAILLEKVSEVFSRLINTEENLGKQAAFVFIRTFELSSFVSYATTNDPFRAVRYEDEPEKKEWGVTLDNTRIARELYALTMDSHEPRLPPRNRKAILAVVTRFYKEGGILEKDVVPAAAAPASPVSVAPVVVKQVKKDVKKDVKKVGKKGLKRTAEEISDDEKTPAEEPAVVEVVASKVKSPTSKSGKKEPIAKVEEPKEEEVATAAPVPTPSKKMKKHPLAEVVAAPTAGKKDKAAVKAAASAVIKKKTVDVSRKEVAVAEPAKPKRNIELRMDKNKIKTFNKLKPIGMIPIDISKASPSKSALKKTQ
ncbi:hypothetical protein HDU77_005356 [Chytriomyces hyalinus]|nr:hypothetical protein HDU77_005356 [Chytriomyces hyalinus]